VQAVMGVSWFGARADDVHFDFAFDTLSIAICICDSFEPGRLSNAPYQDLDPLMLPHVCHDLIARYAARSSLSPFTASILSTLTDLESINAKFPSQPLQALFLLFTFFPAPTFILPPALPLLSPVKIPGR
jgi:hypothetical protein